MARSASGKAIIAASSLSFTKIDLIKIVTLIGFVPIIIGTRGRIIFNLMIIEMKRGGRLILLTISLQHNNVQNKPLHAMRELGLEFAFLRKNLLSMHAG